MNKTQYLPHTALMALAIACVSTAASSAEVVIAPTGSHPRW